MSECLFVYGTLGPGRPNAHVLENIGGTWIQARVRGRLLEEGWGAEMGFPGLKLDAEADWVQGFLFESDSLPDYWAELDAFEGEAYLRVEADVTTDDEQLQRAQVYVLK